MRNEEKKSRGGVREEHKTAWDISVMFVNLQMSWVKDFCLLIMKKTTTLDSMPGLMCVGQRQLVKELEPMTLKRALGMSKNQ